MDHAAQLSKMDPKLKEAYERVMGITTHTGPLSGNTIGSSPQAPIPTIVQKPPVTNNTTMSASSISPPSSGSAAEEQAMPHYEVPLRRSTATVHFETTRVPSPAVHKVKKKGSLSSLLLVMGAIVFFIIYTIVWMKLLDVPIPFLQ